MFTDDFCEDWDSTRNQEAFIQQYFCNKKVNSTTKKSLSKASLQESERSSPRSLSSKNELLLNCQLDCNKKEKREKKSLSDSPKKCTSEIDSQSQNIEIAVSPDNKPNNVKKKESINKNISKKRNRADDSVANTEIAIDNFSANSIENVDIHSSEMDFSSLKKKRKRNKLKNKVNSASVEVPIKIQNISDELFNDPSIDDNNLSEYDSDSNTLRKKKKKLKNKIKNTNETTELNYFSSDAEIVSDTVSEDSLERKNTPSSDNFNSLKKKKIKNKRQSLEHSFFDEAEPINFENSCDSSLKKNNLLQNKAYQKLQAAKFRYLNEMLYTNSGNEALSYFQQNTDEYLDYHQGFQSQVSKWPINPVDIIIQDISKISKEAVIADLGCGEAKIAAVFPKRTVHSFDLIALKDCVTACDMANVPLPTNGVDVVVFCLSLMGTNWKDYLRESQRILKLGGIMKIAEIESRIENLQHFIKEIETFGFSLINQNLSHKMFVFLNFKRANRNKKPSKVPAVTLKPCLYKKR